jgi:DNA invertase Pin-like site-specific DNA recombinase
MKNIGWTERQFDRIRDEFDEEPVEVVRVMHHEQRVPLCHVAAALYVSEGTLRRWCKAWGIETHRSGYEPMTPRGKVERRAFELGYDDVSSAIVAMRQSGMRWEDIQAELHCASSTVSRYMRDGGRGYYNLTERGRQIKRETMKRLNDEGLRGKMPSIHYVVPGGYDCASRL